MLPIVLSAALAAFSQSHDASFMEWCAGPAGILSPLTLRQDATGRYTLATRDMAVQNDPLLQIPLTSCLIADSPQEVADRLIYEMKNRQNSFFAPWLDVLPTLETLQQQLPKFWSAKLWEEVTDGGYAETLLKMRLVQDDSVDPWAMACVTSRQNYIVLPDGHNRRQYSLTPLLDMINHDPTVTTKAYIQQTVDNNREGDQSCLVLEAPGHAHAKGQPVQISYGPLSNADTLVDYGFVTSNNPYNTETINVRWKGQPTPLSVAIEADYTMDASWLAPIRRALATPAECRQVLEASSEDGRDGDSSTAFLQPISSRNEMEVQGVLSAALYDAVEQATEGAARASRPVIQQYLDERARLLTQAMNRVDEALLQQG